jgi:hypothetical protein
MATKTEIEEARDWQGKLLECASCEQLTNQLEGRCRLGHSCVYDRYARRIDRFFHWNPRLAVDYITHPYFEVRAITAKYLDIFHLQRLLHDPDETVRQSVVLRLPANSKQIKTLKTDADREVRIRVAQRLEAGELITMVHDSDYYVRQVVARRLPQEKLTAMVNDRDTEVRKVVARRIGMQGLLTLAQDREASVRLEAVLRLNVKHLKAFVNDPDWRVRYEIAGRLDRANLEIFRNDPELAVRELVEQRLSSYFTFPVNGQENILGSS